MSYRDLVGGLLLGVDHDGVRARLDEGLGALERLCMRTCAHEWSITTQKARYAQARGEDVRHVAHSARDALELSSAHPYSSARRTSEHTRPSAATRGSIGCEGLTGLLLAPARDQRLEARHDHEVWVALGRLARPDLLREDLQQKSRKKAKRPLRRRCRLVFYSCFPVCSTSGCALPLSWWVWIGCAFRCSCPTQMSTIAKLAP